MKCALSLLALVAAASGANLRQPSGLYETPTAEFGEAPSQLNEVSQEPILPVGIPSQAFKGPGCCGSGSQPGPSHIISGVGQPAAGTVGFQSFVQSQSGPAGQPQLQSSQSFSSQSFSNQPQPQSSQSFSSQSFSSQSVQPLVSQPGPITVGSVPVASGGHSQSSYYESSSIGTQSAGSPPKRPSNVFLDNPGLFDQQFTQTIVQEPVPSSYGSNVFLNGQSRPVSGHSSFTGQETVGPVPLRPVGGPLGSGSAPSSGVTHFTSSGYFQQGSGRVPQPALQSGSSSGPVGQFLPNSAGQPSGTSSVGLPLGSGSQGSFSQAAPSGQLLNRHPGGGGSGPLGHRRTCSTSLVCVPLAMCNPYTGFVRGGLLFEPEEPTLQPTVALDRCTKLKDGGIGDGVCCQMPHINDPWPRDQ